MLSKVVVSANLLSPYLFLAPDSALSRISSSLSSNFQNPISLPSSSIRSHLLFNQASLDEPVTLAFPQIRINFRNDSLRGAELLHIIDTLR